MEPVVLFEDNHLFIVNKPQGIATQPTLEEWGKEYLKRPYLHAVHRLDKLASGVVILAKTSKALSRLQESMRERNIEKRYLAIVEGILHEKEGKLEDFLLHDEYRAIISPQGKYSALEYKVLNEKKGLSFIEITLHTGRYHQIRVQFSSRGFPIFGDKKYGSHLSFTHQEGIALHSQVVIFDHPVSHEKLTITAPCPFSF